MAPFVDETRKLIDAVVDDLQAEALGQFEAAYQQAKSSPSGQACVYIDGPEEFLEHGGLVALYSRPPFWVSKSWRYDSEGKHPVPHRTLRRIYRINQVFDKIASDTSFHLAFGSAFRARYLTNLRGEASLLESLTEDKGLIAANEAVRRLLSHVIPVVGNMPLRAVVHLRKKEPEVFVQYRNALTRITDEFLRGRKRLTKKDAAEIYHDNIESEVNRIQQAITSKRKAAANQLFAGAAGLFATVVIGGFALPIAPPIVAALKAGSAMLLGNVAKECFAHSNERMNDFYFLLRLSQAAAKN